MSDDKLTLEEQATNYNTMRHIERVRNLLNAIVVELLERGEDHALTGQGGVQLVLPDQLVIGQQQRAGPGHVQILMGDLLVGDRETRHVHVTRSEVHPGDDELVEITPKSIRLRKRHLKESDRKRASR